MSDKKWGIIKTLIIAVAIIVAASILGGAINQAGVNIANRLWEISNALR